MHMMHTRVIKTQAMNNMKDIRYYMSIVESAFKTNALPYRIEITNFDITGKIEVHLLFSGNGLIELSGKVEKSDQNQDEFIIKFDEVDLENDNSVKSALSLDNGSGINDVMDALNLPLLKSNIMKSEQFKKHISEDLDLDENINPDRWKRVHNNKYLARSKYEERLKKLDDYMQKQKQKEPDDKK